MKFRFYIPLFPLFFMTDMLWAQDFSLKVWNGKIPGTFRKKTYQKVKEYVNAEMHTYQDGGPGYVLSIGKGTTQFWPENCRRWMQERDYFRNAAVR